MKIGPPADKPLFTPAAGTPAAAADVPRTAAGTGTPAPAAASVDASATVALSSTAATLLSGGSSADFDAAKVARMSQAVADGSFRVDPAAIADKLIANAEELLAKVKA